MQNIFIILILIISCSKSEKKDQAPIPEDLKASLIAKKDYYLSVQSQALNEHGYAHEKCDSLGFTALCKAAGGCKDADLTKSEDNGRWYRSPEKDCFDKGESESDFSKDMALMLFVYLYISKDINAMSRFKSYVQANNYVMGRPTDTAEGLSRVVMSAGLISTMNNINAHLHGRLVEPVNNSDDALPAINTGFEAHLDVLKIWLDGELAGYTNDTDDYVLREQVSRQPRNALFQAVYHTFRDGEQSKAIAILLDETLFPSARLPGSNDRCEEYIFQRDDDEDWLPCDQEKLHDAVDYLFTLSILGI